MSSPVFGTARRSAAGCAPASRFAADRVQNPALPLVLSAALFLIFAANPSRAPAGEAADLRVAPAVKSVTLSGFTRAGTVMTLSSEVSGRILSVNYDVGDRIGEKPVARIDPSFIDFDIEAVNLSLKKLDTAMEKNTSRTAWLKKEFERMDRLHKGDRATEVRRDEARENFRQSRLEGESLAAGRQALLVNRKELRERRRRHDIAGFKGWVVVEKLAEAGEFISPGAPVARLADFDRLIVPLAVSGDQLAALREAGDAIPARLEGGDAVCRIKTLNPEFNEKTRKLAVEMELPGHKGEKRGGLRLEIPLKIAAPGIRIPRAAVRNRYENPRVILADGGGESRTVILLGEDGDFFTAAEDPALPPGTRLLPAETKAAAD